MMYHIDHDRNEMVKLDLEYETHLLEVEEYLTVPTMFHKLLSEVCFELFQFHDEIDIHLNILKLVTANK